MRTFLQGNPTVNAIVAAVLMMTLLSVTYFVFEPVVAYGVSDSFTVTQQVTSEIAFKTAPNDVTMTPALQGLTGGNAFGTSTFAINTNNSTGYNMTIQFATTTAMQGETGLTSDINNYTTASGGTADYNWSVGANTGEFGYTVNGVTNPLDVGPIFQDNNSSVCSGGGGFAHTGHCWYNVGTSGNDATSPVTILNRTSATPGTGATSTVIFQVGITANPSPAIQTGFYTATATLTAVTNP